MKLGDWSACGRARRLAEWVGMKGRLDTDEERYLVSVEGQAPHLTRTSGFSLAECNKDIG